MKTKKINSSLILIAIFILSIMPAYGALQAVGPIGDPVNNGFPTFFQDQTGLALQLCLDQDPILQPCLLTPGFDPATPPFGPIGTVLSGAFPDESFYFAASADLSPVNTRLPGRQQDIRILWQAALEQAFLSGIVPGAQSIFLRTQVDVAGLIPLTDYTLQTPYGNIIVTTDAIGGGRTRFEDIVACIPGIPCNFAPILPGAQTGVGPFLRWTADPATPVGFIGNPNIPHTVTGGPLRNTVTATGPFVGGCVDPVTCATAINTVTTDLFSVSGQIAIIDTIAPVIVATTPAQVTQGALNTVATVNLTDNLGVALINGVTIELSPLGSALTATLNGAQEVGTLGSSATGSGTFTIDTTANTLAFNINFAGLPAGDVETTGHIHNAATGANGPTVFNLTPGSPKIGTWNYPENMEAEILAGRTYVQIHSVLFPAGAIRGQIIPVSNMQQMILTAGVRTAGTWSVVIPGPLNRVGTFNLPLVVSDGSQQTQGNLTLSVVSPLAGVNVTPATANVAQGNTVQLTAAPFDQTGAAFVGATTTWESSNTSIATVSPTGLVTGVAPINPTTPATVTITATTIFQGATVTGTSLITVTPTPVLTTITVASASVAAGTFQMNATTLDQFGFPFVGATLAWTSSNTSVATIDPATGIATGVAAGTTTITATSGAISGTGVLTVAQLTSASVTPATASVTIGGTQQLTAATLDQFGNPIQGITTTWASNNASIATVNPTTGVVTGVALGQATITATATPPVGPVVTATSLITVANLANVTVPANSVIIGSTVPMTASLVDQTGAPFVGATTTWTSSNASIATVNATSGVATGVALGQATITATATPPTGAPITATSSIKVAQLSNVTVAANSVIIGSAVQMTASLVDQTGAPFVGATTTWTSSNASIATVNATTGVATGVALGQATIIATAVNGATTVTGNATLTVDPVPPAPVSTGGGSSARRTSGGGGAGGASVNLGDLSTQSQIFSSILAGAPARFDVTATSIGVTSVDLTLNSQASNVRVTVAKENAKPTEVPEAPNKVHAYLTITASNVPSNQIEKGVVNFKVPVSWIADNNVDEATIKLLRDVETEWQELDTRIVGRDSANLNLEATTPGFSTFAIAGEAKTAPAQTAETVTTTTTQQQEQTQPNVQDVPTKQGSGDLLTGRVVGETDTGKSNMWMAILAIFVVIGILVAGYFWYSGKSSVRKYR